MEKWTNRPCLDMNKLIEEIKNLCANIGVAGIDDEPFLEVINKCFIGWFSRSIGTAGQTTVFINLTEALKVT